MRWLSHLMLAFVSLGFLGLIAGIGTIGFVVGYYGQDLPEYEQLKEYKPDVMTRIYAADGDLLAEYATEKRVFVPIQKIPDVIKDAFLSAEDQNFYNHAGIDPIAIARAMVMNLKNIGKDRRLVGASTITQQVAKNFLLTNEVSYERKIKEAILALRLEKALTKDELLELYLNEIFLGQRAYGVASAAQIYFDKSLDELEINEAAYLAALPKAPNNYHPVRKYDAAIARRNWVIDRMRKDGHIEKAQAEIAKEKPLTMANRQMSENIDSDFFAEEVRRIVKSKYGQESLYQGGLTVKSSLHPVLQNMAADSLRKGLMDYDKRHGWRGPIATLKSMDNWQEDLNKIAEPAGQLDNWEMAVVTNITIEKAALGFSDGSISPLPLEGLRWARKCLQDCYALGAPITSVEQVLDKGNVVLVEKIDKEYVLRQIPKVQGAIIALDPHTGRVLAMQGGWTQNTSSFNRATQAMRQPGSAFKPFVYLAALDNGFTPASIVVDGPFEKYDAATGKTWRPTNYSNKFYGPSTLRVGLEKSRNLMTVRLANNIGMQKVSDYAKKFGINDNMRKYLSHSLGAGETTLLKLTAAYGMLANGGKKITPTFIDRIQDREGKTIFSFDDRPCANCGDLIKWDGQRVPEIKDTREQIADEKTAYQITSMLEGVVQRGTATRLKSLNRPLAGKTGTTNESKDTWFIGYSPNLVVGVFVGFDEPKSLGKKETGSSVAAPIFGDFMAKALEDEPAIPFRSPPGMKNMRINSLTGRLAGAGDRNVIWEAFIPGTEPTFNNYAYDEIIDGSTSSDPYGYAQSDTPIYNDGSVEIYDLENVEDGDDSFSYFSNRNTQSATDTDQEQPYSTERQERVYIPNTNLNKRPSAPKPTPQEQEPSITGTGGIY